VSTKAIIRLRMSSHDAHYGGNLVDGARMLGLFGDVATELCIRLAGAAGLDAGDEEVRVHAPLRAGDVVEAVARLVGVGTRSRKLARTAHVVCRGRPDRSPSAALTASSPRT
jgi:3-aminobutyryl-CoA ammonia-lyase